jgi:hypothetical protein
LAPTLITAAAGYQLNAWMAPQGPKMSAVQIGDSLANPITRHLVSRTNEAESNYADAVIGFAHICVWKAALASSRQACSNNSAFFFLTTGKKRHIHSDMSDWLSGKAFDGALRPIKLTLVASLT